MLRFLAGSRVDGVERDVTTMPLLRFLVFGPLVCVVGRAGGEAVDVGEVFGCLKEEEEEMEVNVLKCLTLGNVSPFLGIGVASTMVICEVGEEKLLLMLLFLSSSSFSCCGVPSFRIPLSGLFLCCSC